MNRLLVEKIDCLRRQYQEEIQPFIDVKINWHNVTVPTIIVKDNGDTTREYNYPPGIEEMLKLLDEHLERVAEKYKNEMNRAYKLYDFHDVDKIMSEYRTGCRKEQI